MPLGNNLKTNSEKSPIEEAELQVDEPTSNSPEPNEVVEDVSSEENFSQYCVFKAGDEEYAIPIDIVKEVVKYSEPASLPQMPRYIIGMSNVRGNIYGIMDLDIFFRGESRDKNHQYLLVLDHDVYKMAIRIQDVPSSLMVSDTMVEELSSATMKSVIGQKYLKGIIKKDQRMIILFDILEMISSDMFTEVA